MGPGPGRARRRHRVQRLAGGAASRDGDSLTAKYLRGELTVDRGRRRLRARIAAAAMPTASSFAARASTTCAASTSAIPLNRLVCITGVSGSGKSTLVQDVLTRPAEAARQAEGRARRACRDRRLRDARRRRARRPSADRPHDALESRELRRRARADPQAVRRRAARARAQLHGRHVQLQRRQRPLPACSGNGFEHVEMQFLSDVYLRCAECDGRRYRSEVLEVKLALRRTRAEVDRRRARHDGRRGARLFRRTHEDVRERLQPLVDVGLDYLTLGQPVPTLSGGEAQRLKLAARARGRAAARRVARCSCSTSRRRACTSPTSRSSSRALAAARRRGPLGGRHRAQPRRHRVPPTGSSTSAPKAATPAARSSPPALPPTCATRRRPHRAALADYEARFAGAGGAAEAMAAVTQRRRPERRRQDVADAAYRDVFSGPGRPVAARRHRLRCERQRDRDRGAREHNLRNIDRRDPARQAHRHHRRQRQRQEHRRVRHPVRRGPAPLSRVAERVRAPVRRSPPAAPTSTPSTAFRRRSRSSSARAAAAARAPSRR